MQTEQIRKDQAQDARNRILSVPNREGRGVSAPKRPFVAKGHDAILKGMQDAGSRVIIVTMGDGSEHVGKLVARDKFTITILTDAGSRRTFYKHAIESFEPVESVQ